MQPCVGFFVLLICCRWKRKDLVFDGTALHFLTAQAFEASSSSINSTLDSGLHPWARLSASELQESLVLCFSC